MKVAGLFAGVGGIEIGFEQAGFEPVYANEVDLNASKTYRVNHKHELVVADINDLDSKTFPDHDVLTGGFPCQPFSIGGLRQGFNDAKGRGNVFFKIMEIAKEKKPSVIFLENVKNLVGHDNGNTFKVILEALKDEGYHVKYQVLNSKLHGNIPQGRERIFIVGFRDEEAYEKFSFPDEIPLTTSLRDCIDFDNPVEERFYYRAGTSKVADDLLNANLVEGVIYQHRRSYIRENKSGVSPTLTANMGTGGHNVPVVSTKFGVRKLTPRECFNLMGFPKSFVFPNGLAVSHLYKQSGNAVVVPVVKRIADNIMLAVKP